MAGKGKRALAERRVLKGIEAFATAPQARGLLLRLSTIAPQIPNSANQRRKDSRGQEPLHARENGNQSACEGPKQDCNESLPISVFSTQTVFQSNFSPRGAHKKDAGMHVPSTDCE